MPEHGVLLLGKDRRLSSARALAAAKRLLALKKAGHGGTLDPLASGLLVLLFGDATRYAQYLLGGSKAYTATLRFGHTSDTDDADGNLAPGTAPPPALGERIAALLPDFCGAISQVAPAYSALKHQGKPLYAYARRGDAAPQKKRQVRIDHIDLLAAGDDHATLAIACGGGVYIRALARDIGAALGCGAYLAALQRTACGQHTLQQAVTLDELAAGETVQQRRRHLLPVDSIVSDLPAVTLPQAQLQQLGSGIRVAPPRGAAPRDTVRIMSPRGRFAGLATYRDGRYHPLRFLSWTRQPSG